MHCAGRVRNGTPAKRRRFGGAVSSYAALSKLPTARSMMAGQFPLVLTGACQFGHGVGGFATNFIHSAAIFSPEQRSWSARRRARHTHAPPDITSRTLLAFVAFGQKRSGGHSKVGAAVFRGARMIVEVARRALHDE